MPAARHTQGVVPAMLEGDDVGAVKINKMSSMRSVDVCRGARAVETVSLNGISVTDCFGFLFRICFDCQMHGKYLPCGGEWARYHSIWARLPVRPILIIMVFI